VHRWTDGSKAVEIRYGEGLANDTAPQSCAGAREGTSEALIGVRAGEAWSGESNIFRSADAVAGRGSKLGFVIARKLATLRRH
jgi:hypothetical protein